MKYGPDGGVYLTDWYDTGECHTLKAHRENGRVYKITYNGGGNAEAASPCGRGVAGDAERGGID